MINVIRLIKIYGAGARWDAARSRVSAELVRFLFPGLIYFRGELRE